MSTYVPAKPCPVRKRHLDFSCRYLANNDVYKYFISWIIRFKLASVNENSCTRWEVAFSPWCKHTMVVGGEGIDNSGTLTINNCVVSGNSEPPDIYLLLRTASHHLGAACGKQCKYSACSLSPRSRTRLERGFKRPGDRLWGVFFCWFGFGILAGRWKGWSIP